MGGVSQKNSRPHPFFPSPPSPGTTTTTTTPMASSPPSKTRHDPRTKKAEETSTIPTTVSDLEPRKLPETSPLPELSSPSSASLPGGFFLELLVFPHFFRMFVLRDREAGKGKGGGGRGTRVKPDSGIPGSPTAPEGGRRHRGSSSPPLGLKGCLVALGDTLSSPSLATEGDVNRPWD